eukprot:533806_1
MEVDCSEFSLLLEIETDEKCNTNTSISNEFIFDKTDLCKMMSHWMEEYIAISYLAQMGGVEGIAYGIKSNIVSGLSSDELKPSSIQNRKQKYGINKLTMNENKSLFHFCYEQTNDFILRLIIIAAIITLIVNGTNKQIVLIIESIIMVFLLFIFILSIGIFDWKTDQNNNKVINL